MSVSGMFSLFRNSKCKVTNFYRNVSIVLLCISGLVFPCYPEYGVVPLLSSVVFYILSYIQNLKN